jgi:hypothetical protein
MKKNRNTINNKWDYETNRWENLIALMVMASILIFLGVLNIDTGLDFENPLSCGSLIAGLINVAIGVFVGCEAVCDYWRNR